MDNVGFDVLFLCSGWQEDYSINLLVFTKWVLGQFNEI